MTPSDRCSGCDSTAVEDVDGEILCMDCGEVQDPHDDENQFFRVGLIAECTKIVNKDRLFKTKVDVGDERMLTVVTNAPNVKVGCKVVIAMVGAKLGHSEDGIIVERTKIANTNSEAVICESANIPGWPSSNKGRAVIMPDEHVVGSAPPAEKPRHS